MCLPVSATGSPPGSPKNHAAATASAPSAGLRRYASGSAAATRSGSRQRSAAWLRFQVGQGLQGIGAEPTRCAGCHAVGLVRPAEVTDHVVPHKGDQALFWSEDNLQSGCSWHHDTVKQRLEALYQAGAIAASALRLDSAEAIALTRALDRS